MGLTPMKYGASLKYVGRKMAPSGSEENFFEVNVPAIDFPGVFTLQPVSTVYVKHMPNGELLIEGHECTVRGGPKELDDLQDKFINFYLKATLTLVDKPRHQELIMKGGCRIALDPPGIYANLMPKEAFEQVGAVSTKTALDVLLKGFVQSFSEDYEKKWAIDAAYRKDRTAKAAK